MLSWLRNLFSAYASVVLGGIRTLIEDLADGIEWALSHLFSGIKKAWNNFWYGAHQVWWGCRLFSWQTEAALWQIAYTVLPRVNRTFATHWRAMWHLYDVNEKLSWHLYETNRTYSFGLVASLTKYVVLHILAPLLSLAVKVTWYIVNRISPLWDLVMHPDKLAIWIFWHFIALIEKLALDVARATARFFFALFVHNLRTILLILEDAIVAIL